MKVSEERTLDGKSSNGCSLDKHLRLNYHLGWRQGRYFGAHNMGHLDCYLH